MYGTGTYDEYLYDDMSYPILDDYAGCDTIKYSRGTNESTIGDIYKSNSQAVESFFLRENIERENTKNSTPTYKKVLENPVKFAGNIINNIKNTHEKFQSDVFSMERRVYIFMILILVFVIILAYIQNKSLQNMLLKSLLRGT